MISRSLVLRLRFMHVIDSISF
uniref:Uncharacterized protein n=1 Tax=Anopheles arabiensis TaxID=7173 RepID=A0A182IH37_ANOAR